MGVKDERFWDDSNRKRFCRGCGIDRGGVVKMKEERGKPTEERLAEAPTATRNDNKPPLSQTPKVRCPLTQRWHTDAEMITVYARDHEPIRISQFAADVITVQYWAKVQGLWTIPRPTPKPTKDVQEAKA